MVLYIHAQTNSKNELQKMKTEKAWRMSWMVWGRGEGAGGVAFATCFAIDVFPQPEG